MSTRLRDVMMRELEGLRHEPIEKRIRGMLGDETVLDSTRALLVWEPKRVVPHYAVPEDDVHAELTAAPPAGPGADADIDAPMLAGRPVLDPSIPFTVHTTEGEPLTLRARRSGREALAFRPADPALAGQVVVDFAGLDAWYEEEEPNVGHPRDPFHRIDVTRSSRHVVVRAGGQVVAESSRPRLLFEPPLPVRYYLPPEDVRLDRLARSETRTTCAYKGHATYWSLPDGDDVAWTYAEPLADATEVEGWVAFFNERVDLVVDGEPLERPITPWSRRG